MVRAIEFFSGIGGWRYALKGRGQTVSALDISEIANGVYKHNFGDSPITREIATISAGEIIAMNANMWLMSPPCQPFCRMGKGLGLEDARSAGFLRLMDLIVGIRPKTMILENVEGFLESAAFELLSKCLDGLDYGWYCFKLCPTQFGIPNRRPRIFVAASLLGIQNETPPTIGPQPVGNYLDAAEDESLYLSEGAILRHGLGMDIVDAESRRSACFIGGYGKRFVGSGSFLKTEKGVRRFSPPEISRLMGYPPGFGFPSGMPINKKYQMLGNGLNLVVAEWVLDRVLLNGPQE
jgi:DNA (cytosine-5)-methyltransferase 1/tRNA (cytosine38-C5)-methyltransferase